MKSNKFSLRYFIAYDFDQRKNVFHATLKFLSDSFNNVITAKICKYMIF